MTPGKLDLPSIWRGCDWGPVTFTWKDQNGDRIDLSGWIPKVFAISFSLGAQVQDPSHGVTTLSLTRE